MLSAFALFAQSSQPVLTPIGAWSLCSQLPSICVGDESQQVLYMLLIPPSVQNAGGEYGYTIIGELTDGTPVGLAGTVKVSGRGWTAVFVMPGGVLDLETVTVEVTPI
jgi:hypothetical protein